MYKTRKDVNFWYQFNRVVSVLSCSCLSKKLYFNSIRHLLTKASAWGRFICHLWLSFKMQFKHVTLSISFHFLALNRHFKWTKDLTSGLSILIFCYVSRLLFALNPPLNKIIACNSHFISWYQFHSHIKAQIIILRVILQTVIIICI